MGASDSFIVSLPNRRIFILAAFVTTTLGLMASVGLIAASATVLLTGMAVVSASYLMIWSLRIGRGFPRAGALAVAAVAILLPELSAESYFAWTSVASDGLDASGSSLFASMTGANHLIVGFAWPALILLVWARNRGKTVTLRRGDGVSLSLLFLATLYAFNIYIKGYVSILDSVVLALLFAVFVWLNARRGETPQPSREELALDADSGVRRAALIGAFVFAAIATLIVSGTLAASLASLGGAGGRGFALAQLAIPLASKGAWLALMGALVLNAREGQAARLLMTAQAGLWMLLIAALPVISLTHGSMLGNADVLMLGDYQRSELLLAASQAIFTLAILSAMAVSWRSAAVMLGLSLAQGAFISLQPEADATAVQGMFSAIYLIIAAIVVAKNRARARVLAGLMNVNRSGLRRIERQPQLALAESESIAGRLQARPDTT